MINVKVNDYESSILGGVGYCGLFFICYNFLGQQSLAAFTNESS